MTPWLRGHEEPFVARRQGWWTLGLVAFINALLFGLCLILAIPGYETNDDLRMQLIASGFFTGEPSTHLIYIQAEVCPDRCHGARDRRY